MHHQRVLCLWLPAWPAAWLKLAPLAGLCKPCFAPTPPFFALRSRLSKIDCSSLLQFVRAECGWQLQ